MDVEHPAYAGYRFQLLIRCLQRWAKLAMYAKSAPKGRFYHSDFLEKIWSGRRDSNPRPQPWQGPQAIYARVSICALYHANPL